MTTSVRRLALLTGVVCVCIGVFHLLLGVTSVPGEALAGATVDSRERFYGAVFAGYGVAWVWAARTRDARPLWWLAGVLLLGGLGRLLSLAVHGAPQWFQLVLTGVELVLPLLFFALLAASRRNLGRVRPA